MKWSANLPSEVEFLLFVLYLLNMIKLSYPKILLLPVFPCFYYFIAMLLMRSDASLLS